jgi:mono/diheme cytochrome c family protein
VNSVSRLVWVSVLSWLVSLPLLGCTTGGEAPPPSPAEPNAMLVEVGRDAFLTYCAACHGSDGRGAGPAAAALTTPPADLTRIAARRGGDFPADDIAAWIDGRMALPAHGTREMPIWGYRFAEGLPPGELSQDLVRGRILTVVEYLRSIQAP